LATPTRNKAPIEARIFPVDFRRYVSFEDKEEEWSCRPGLFGLPVAMAVIPVIVVATVVSVDVIVIVSWI
jgi:hypothetical protein